MGQVDFGKIISAAAVSTLGVLSLIVVALGVIAFYFFKGSGDKVKLSVWLTMLLAGALFAAAVVRQAEPGRRDPDPRPTATPEPVDPVDSGETDTPEPEPSATPGRVVGPPPTPTPTPAPVATETAAAYDPADLTGQWRDNDGYTYNIKVMGNAIGIQQWMNGMAAGYGQGTIDGRNMRYGFVTADGNQGSCVAAAESTKRITGSCTSGTGAAWPFAVER